MSLQFIVGRAGSGKSTYLLNLIKEHIQTSSLESPLIYLVPDQMTFQTEYELIRSTEIKGMMNVQVLSFSRLALRLLQEVGGITRIHIDSVGISMVLRRIIEARKHELKVFQRSSDQQGFYEHLEQMITECKRYCQSPEHLLQAQEQPLTPILKDKLHDLQLIYSDFQQYLMGRYMDSEDYLQWIVEKIPSSSYLNKAKLYVDGFHQFTPQEQQVIQALMKRVVEVKIALTVDQPYDQELPHDLHLFYPTAKTYQQLRQLALSAKIKLESPLHFTAGLRYKDEMSLAHIEQYYDQRPPVAFDSKGQVHLLAGVNRRTEVEAVARQLIRLVRDEGYRYREIALLIRDVALYQDMIETVFQDYQIPIFIDQKRTMLHHPLIELLRSTFDCFLQNWRYEAVFRCIKTDLIFPWDSLIELQELREEFDLLENYVLAYGIKGKNWTNKERWQLSLVNSLEEQEEFERNEEHEAEEERMNALRQMIANPLHKLQQKLQKAENVRGMCEAIYYYLEEIQAPEKIDCWRAEAEAQGNLRLSREHHQVWKAVVHLLDQLVEIMGDESVSLELFSQMIAAGCDSMRFALVPPALDQVLVGNIETSRFTNVKCAFILGCNDGILPAKPKEEGLITEEERELLEEGGTTLASSRQKLMDEHFVIYTAMSTASEKLWLSYALADEEGKSLTPSVILPRLKQLFPLMQEELIVNEPYETAEEQQKLFLATPESTLSYLASEIRQWKRGYSIPDFWWDVYNWMIQDSAWKEKTCSILSSLHYQNQAKPLAQAITRELYGEYIQLSVSRMERFTACPFTQFISHGLRLKERQIYKLEAPDVGQLFHASIKMIDDLLKENGRSWRELSKDECKQLAQSVVAELAPKLQKNILSSSHRHHYIKRKLEQVISRATTVLSEHAKSSQFYPIGMEIEFGPQGQLPGLVFTLDNGVKMEVVGRIDRVDQAESSQGLMVRVVDYKSSQTILDLSKVYYGLSLQMLTYLDIVITHSKAWLGTEAIPAGVLYFHVHNPLINHSGALPTDILERELFKQFKMKGLVLADQEAVQLMDTTLETQYSEVIPVALKKDGQFYSNSSVASQQDFEHMKRFVRQQIKSIGLQMTSGKIDIKPFKMKKEIACTFCQYRTICQFDLDMEEHEFTILSAKSKENMLEQIRQRGGATDEQDDDEASREYMDR